MLHRKKCLIGYPNILWDVKVAKEIKWKIGDKALLGGGKEDYNLGTTTFIGLEV